MTNEALKLDFMEPSTHQENEINAARKDALAAFERNGFPTVALEEWRYTDPKVILEAKFKNFAGTTPESKAKTLASTSTIDAYRFVFLNGSLVTSTTVFEQGVVIVSLAEALNPAHPVHGKVSGHFAKIAKTEESFVAVNTAFSNDGFVLFVDKNCATKKPIELLFVTTSEAAETTLYPRILCVLEQGAQATIIERYISENNEEAYFTNAVLECTLGKNAQFHHYRVQEESEKAFHVSTIQGAVEKDAVFKTHTFSFGGKLVRNHVNVVMNGSNADITMNGLSVLGRDQHVDNTTLLDHAQPHCESLELYKGIYGDKSQGVFSGTIIVREDAQKTNAIQSNRSVLLSNEAQVNTKPQLKIWADDVKCTHGATIGQLDDEALFYIQARGVGKKEAKMMLVQAFASEIISGVTIEALKEELEEKLEAKLARIA